MDAQGIFDKLKEKFSDDVKELVTEETSNPFINVEATSIFDISLFLRDDNELDFDYLTLLSGVDAKDSITVVYHLYSTAKNPYRAKPGSERLRFRFTNGSSVCRKTERFHQLSHSTVSQ